MNTATGTKTTTTSVTRNPNRRGHCAVLAVLFAMGASAAQAATTLWVDHAAMPMSSNTGCGPNAGYTTIGAAASDTGGQSTAQATYLEARPDNVQILGNDLRNVHSDRSATGVTIGDSNSTKPSQNILIDGNSIENITSDTRGAYGVSINDG